MAVAVSAPKHVTATLGEFGLSDDLFRKGKSVLAASVLRTRAQSFAGTTLPRLRPIRAWVQHLLGTP